jgi:hypothetical protein
MNTAEQSSRGSAGPPSRRLTINIGGGGSGDDAGRSTHAGHGR